MAVMTDRISIPAASTERNVLRGRIFEFLRDNSQVQLGVVSAFGTPAGDIRFTFTIGDQVVVERASAKVEQALGRGVNINEDLNIVDVGVGGSQLNLEISNANVGAVDIEFYALISNAG